jgi:endonuclease YncB( thermonuclease family)
MKNILSPKFLALAATAVISTFPTLLEAKEIHLKGTRARITKVIDGDTFSIDLSKDHQQETVRVLGIDCPEKKVNDKCIRENGGIIPCNRDEVPLGLKAKSVADVMINREVTLVGHHSGNTFKLDRYGRVLAYVQEADEDYGLRMIKGGFCEDNSDKFPHPRQNEYRQAQEKAGKFPLKPIKKSSRK